MDSVVIVGIGELGGVFARGFLRTGMVVVPVNRTDSADVVSVAYPDPRLCLVAVGEDDLDPVLATLPNAWLARTGLLQNELLPRSWAPHGIDDPTVAVVWFEKKPGRETKEIIETPVAGPAARLVVEALNAVDIDAHEVTRSAIDAALVAKNLYILTANIAGLETRGSVSDLWYQNRAIAESVADEVASLQQRLLGRPFDVDGAKAEMVRAFDADPEHGSMGRSAPTRLRRALAHADEFGVAVPTLRRIAEKHLDTDRP